MIDPVLKKFGLSEARKSVKSLNNTFISLRTPRKNNQNQSIVQIEPEQSQALTPDQTPRTPRQKSQNTLQKLISYLNKNNQAVCPFHPHRQNKMKFICLNESCAQNLGCAECFLYKHNNHPKTQISVCFRQLGQMQSLMNYSYQLILCQKKIIKQQMIKQIQLQINHMCDQFHRNLQFMKNKALKQIDDHLFSKYQQLKILASLRANNIEQIPQHKLIGQIIKIDIKGIQRNLNSQVRQLGYEKLNVQPIVKYFQQMNGALGHFMAEFKKCFPKLYNVQEEQLNSSRFFTKQTKPELLKHQSYKNDQQTKNYTLDTS